MSNFISESNKKLIWNILEQNGTFNRLSQEQKNEVSSRFNNIVNEIEMTDSKETIMNKNKNLILKITEVSNTLYNSTINTQSSIPITSQDIADVRQTQFTDSLKAKQDEFNTFMKKETPDEINFSDKLDKPIGSELDSMLSDAMARREMDLNSFPKPPEASKQTTTTNSFIPNLVIGQTVDISNESIKIEKVDNLVNHSEQLNLIINKLNSIEETQIKLASQLTNIYQHITDSSINITTTTMNKEQSSKYPLID
tara:strand:+ start:163 stop:924 length:762 start_codon:yes stop_codon:yes gene_type:complete